MWLFFYLRNTMKIQPFSPAFPLAESIAKALGWLFLWSFKEKASAIFYDTAITKSLSQSGEGFLFSFIVTG